MGVIPRYYFVLKGRPSKKGKVSVFLRYAHGGKTYWKSAKISVLPQNWDERREQVKPTDPAAHIYNAMLLKMKNSVAEYINKTLSIGLEPTFEQFISDGDYKPKNTINTDYLLTVIELLFSRQKISKGTRRAYKAAVVKFQGFLKNPILIEKITPDLVARFRDFVRKENNENTAAQYLTFLQSCWKHFVRMNDLEWRNPFRHETINIVRISDKKTITEEEYQIIKAHFEANRDDISRRFLLLCKGIRFSDSNNIVVADIIAYKGIYYYNITSKKTGVKGVIVFDQWDMDNLIPKNKMLMFRPMQLGNYNIQLKIITKFLLGREITSHYGRHYAGDSLINSDKFDREDVKAVLGITTNAVSEIYAERKILTILDKFLK